MPWPIQPTPGPIRHGRYVLGRAPHEFGERNNEGQGSGGLLALCSSSRGSATSGETDGGIPGNHSRTDDGGIPGAAGSDAASGGMTSAGSSGSGDDSGSPGTSSSEAGGGDLRLATTRSSTGHL